MADVRIDEPFVLVPVLDVRNLHVGHSSLDNFRIRVDDVLLVLSAAGVRPLCRADEADRPLHSCAGHLPEGVRQERMPVAHPDEHGHVMTSGPEPGLKTLCLLEGDFRERRDAAEMFVVTDDLIDALWWNSPSAEHVGEKRPDVGRTLRTTKRNDKDGVERAACGHERDQW